MESMQDLQDAILEGRDRSVSLYLPDMGLLGDYYHRSLLKRIPT